MRDVLRHLIESLEAGREVVLCRVVATRGSTPQKAGAAMLLTPDGGQVGTLGGGCVEEEVKRRAAGMVGLADSGAELHSFVLNHDYAWADGLICGGRMVILAECPRASSHLDYFRAWRDLLEAGRGLTEAVVIDPTRAGGAVGDRSLFDHEAKLHASLGDEPPAGLAEGVAPLDSRPRASEANGVAYLPTMPRVRLVIVGAGHVGRAVAELASRADFEVWVVDDRRDYASPDRFPTAARRMIGPIGRVLADLDVTSQTYALIVTRGHGHDQEALALLAPTAAAYVGMIGSRRKIRMIFDALLDEGIDPVSLDRVSAPVGLDIGSEGVDEIAVSIVAELIARRNRGPEAVADLRSTGRRVSP